MRGTKDALKALFSCMKYCVSQTAFSQDALDIWKDLPVIDFDEIKARGEYPVVFAAKNRDDNVRRESSSGGMFYALASHVIDNLDGVVYGCAFDKDLRAVHIRCETMTDVKRCMGSKYSQSDMGDSIRMVQDDLKEGRTVLFTGTPCQVAAIRAVCGNTAGGYLMTVDIICHGTPSPALFQTWLSQLELARGQRVIRYEHRPKSCGWGHFERVTWEDNHSEQKTRWAEGWKRLFYDNRCLRPSCYRCPYTISYGRPGDFTIADFWGIEDTDLADFSDSLGVSLVLVNRSCSLAVLSTLDVELQRSSLKDCLSRNPMLERPSIYKGKRSIIWESIYQNGLIAAMRHERFLASPMRFLASHAKRGIKRLLGR